MVTLASKTSELRGEWKAASRSILALALPLILTHLAHVALTTIDIVVLGRLGALELAAGGLAIALFNQLRTTGTGLVTGVSNLVAEAHARGEPQRIRDLLVAGCFWATVCGVVFISVLLLLKKSLLFLGQDPEVIESAMRFLFVISPGLLPCLWFQTLRHFTVGLKYPGPLLVITLISILLTGGFNIIFVFGKLGFPALGLQGVALKTAIVFLLSFIMFLGVFLRIPHLAAYCKLSDLRWSSDAVRAVWRLGIPIAGAKNLFTI